MSSLRLLQHVRTALNNLNPSEVEEAASRRVHVVLRASTDEVYLQMEELFGCARRTSKALTVERADETSGQKPDVELVEMGLQAGETAVPFDPIQPRLAIEATVEKYEEFALALARNCAVFRPVVVRRAIQAISRENALFTAATAAPNIIPLLSLPFSVGEFASDTAFLTMNQIRLGFLIAGAYGRPVGYRIQKAEIATVIASAFGWRALARTLIGHIPFGGGIIPKAAVAYAGTLLVGKSLVKYYSSGSALTPVEQRETYDRAYESGKTIVRNVLQESRR